MAPITLPLPPMADHVISGAASFFSNPLALAVVLASWLLALAAYAVIRTQSASPRQKIAAIYAHLFFLILPLFLFGQSLQCPTGDPGCAVSVTKATSFTLPLAVASAAVLGIFLAPRLNLYKSRRVTAGRLAGFLAREAALAGVPNVELYAFESSRPMAFSQLSATSRIFLSVGMMEMLTAKELEAVALHELEHLRRATPALKASALVYGFFSPFSAVRQFNAALGAEEAIADGYAAARQGTWKHVHAAKAKAIAG